jgi:hypothetical protein
MFVAILYPEGWGSLNDIGYCPICKIGLDISTESKFLYKVIDKQLFLLSVIKYGIDFREV